MASPVRARASSAQAASLVERGSVRAADTTIEYEVVRSHRRRKTVEIRVESDLRVRVAAPLRTSRRRVAALVQQRSTWILRRAEELAARSTCALASGERVPYLGRELAVDVRVDADAPQDVTRDGDLLLVQFARAPQPAAIRAAIERWYRQRAEAEFAGRVAYWSRVIGARPRRVVIGSQRSRWGSCARDGTIRFTWRALLVPSRLVDYLVVHELAHLKAPDHSAAFWALVAGALPDYEERRRSLRASGTALEA